jgi:hypothetical protein
MSDLPAFGARATALIASKGTADAINPANSQEQKLDEAKEQRRRIPMSVPRAKMATPEIAGYHTHWINDYPGRILQAQAAGYDFVDEAQVLITMPSIAGDVLGVGTDMGSRVSIVVGKNEDGTPLRAFLMRIPLEYYKEDLLAAQQRVDQVHEAMQQARYIPSGTQVTEADLRKQYAAGSIKSVRRSSTYTPV